VILHRKFMSASEITNTTNPFLYKKKEVMSVIYITVYQTRIGVVCFSFTLIVRFRLIFFSLVFLCQF